MIEAWKRTEVLDPQSGTLVESPVLILPSIEAGSAHVYLVWMDGQGTVCIRTVLEREVAGHREPVEASNALVLAVIDYINALSALQERSDELRTLLGAKS